MLKPNEEDFYTQKYFEDIKSMNQSLRSDPKNIPLLFEDLKQLMVDRGFKDPEEIKSLAITMLTFPFSGKVKMTEAEIEENYNKLLLILEDGILEICEN
jgi:hypothetical protein